MNTATVPNGVSNSVIDRAGEQTFAKKVFPPDKAVVKNQITLGESCTVSADYEKRVLRAVKAGRSQVKTGKCVEGKNKILHLIANEKA